MNLLDQTDARSRELVEATLGFKASHSDFAVDETFYLGQDLATFLFVDGTLRSSPTLQGISLKKVMAIEPSEMNRALVYHALHQTLQKEVYELTVEKNLELQTPVRILRLQTRGNLEAPTLVVKVGKFSKLTLLEESQGLDGDNISVGETHLHIDSGAKVEHIHAVRGSGNSKHQGSTFAHVQRDATYKNVTFHLEGSLNQRTLDLHLLGEGSHGESHILYLLQGQEKSTVDTVIHHYTPDSTSAQLAKGILDGESRGSFTGRIHIHKDAQRVNSSQLNKNLLLSRKAQAFSEPQLEIFADDVKCSHGSTTGQLSPEELFYFQARGIPHERARNLLALGFGLEVVTKLEDVKARHHLEAMIKDNLKTKFNLGGGL